MQARALPQSADSLEQLTDDLIDFSQTSLVHQITGGVHVNDAFIQDAWGKLPAEWTNHWDSLPDSRIAQRDMIDSIDEGEHTCQSPRADSHESALSRPESLVSWLAKLKSVSLPRIQRNGPVLVLPKVLADRMETKKLNEVSVAAPYIHSICQASGVTHIIDMGSGQGYLSNTLAYLFPSLRILAIDGSESQIAGSKAFATFLGITEDRIQHLVRYIDGSMKLASEIDAWAGGQKCLLVGLHACGNLSEHMIKYFAACSSITHLAAVGCCYNHIVIRSETCPDGFPISERLRERNVTLTPTALMAGCQAPNNWARTDLTKPKSIYSRKQFYRSLLEKMFHDKGVQIHDKPNWGIRKGDLANFESFTRRVVEYLGVEQHRISKLDITKYENQYASQEGRISILWTLSVLCCKAIESIIALDRYWFLVENGGHNVEIVPIFDYKISPRNLMIVAEKHHKH
ncbi:hypothetical protein KVR01_005959 [Diaporthe batatas]|uniref:uncharacterized protein n=1 Tax=Diaporthe batatas TaxID=748121 RepID=UPI001D059EB9|nr:uncharacterized protein KVR01_005959 [Diaporthe batatas]KAG8164041.1 hypothetical protein KVR01_005959 [Diaporthe batatas]